MATPVAKPDNLIAVPKPSRSAYNPDRPLHKNLLIKAQVQHFFAVEQNLPPQERTGIDIDTVTTEGLASAYIRRVTEAIHRVGGVTEKVRTAK